jgi:hypothetical protein
MNARWWLVVCALVLSACGGGGGDDSVAQSPFQVLVQQSRSQPLESVCAQRQSYSELESFEVRVSANGQMVEGFDRESYHSSSNCSGAALVRSRVLSNTAEVPVVRITYVSSLLSAQVRLLNGRTLNTPVDRVNVRVNPEAGVYQFDFLGVTGTQQTTGFTTSASFMINGVPVDVSSAIEPPINAALGMAVVNGQVITLVPESDTVFVQTVEQ